MASQQAGPAVPPTDDEMAYLQKLSNEWQPEPTGPLVGERQSSTAIATEYAAADPVYRQKTANLPSTYSHYRTCRGDGHCGWRAVAFSYFEALQRVGDRHKFLEEETRLRSFGNLLTAVGHEEHLYEDFADEMYSLLRETAENTPALDNGAALLAAFNDEAKSMAIITFLKILTSAWIQTRPDQYEPFIQEPAREYCRSKIEPVASEIEHVGMSALCDVLPKPAGVAVEILYLDRSPGDQVNIYRFDPADIGITTPDPPTIRMLYRPGHYDILYKIEDIPQPIMQPTNIAAPVFVAMPAGPDHITTHIANSEYVPEFLDDIPGLSRPSFAPSTWYSSDFVSSSMTPAPIAPTQSVPTATMPTPVFPPVAVAQMPQPPKYAPPMPLDPPIGLPLSTPMMMDRDGGPFRPSVWQMEPDFAASQSHMQFQTSIFRNSHFNTAHFRNPDFQPEEWSPDAEYSSSSSKSSCRHKAAG